VVATVAAAAEPVKLAPNAPTSYVVVKGDTLWDIAGKFLEKPWRWPEIWHLNQDQIKDPHWIYPGDVIVLDLSGGDPRLRLGKRVGDDRLSPQVQSELIPREIPSIPVHVIEPFISKPLIVGANDMRDAPRIIGTDESRVILGNGDNIYVLGLEGNHPRWHIYRPGTPVRNPVGKPTTYAEWKARQDQQFNDPDILGYEAVYLGTAQVRTPGEVTIMEVLTAKEEILKGDLLVPAEEPTLEPYMPHEPSVKISGNIASVYGGVGSGGKDSVVALNVGAKNGIERGHVLGLFSRRTTVFKDKDGKARSMDLPEERYGVIFVFRVFDQVSYGLVMEASIPLTIGDVVKNP
jgi:hypothetical protein